MKKVLIPTLFLALLSFQSCEKGVSYSFSYPKMDNNEKIEEEIRYFPKNSEQDVVIRYVYELMLGPETRRLQPIFSLATPIEYCFVDSSNVLYIGLEKSAIFELPNDVDIQKRVKLMEDNIYKNFKNISKIVLFIDGKVVNE